MGVERERETLRPGTPIKKWGGRAVLFSAALQEPRNQGWTAGIKKGTLTRLHVLTRQAWPRNMGQASCTQGSMAVGLSFKEHTVAWTRDSPSPRQVTLLFLMPAPQVTEHCKDRLLAGTSSSPGELGQLGQLEAYQPGIQGSGHCTALIPLPSPESLL